MKKVSVLAAAVAGVLVFAAPATAAKPHFATDVTINFVGDQYGGAFYGEVFSAKDKCENHRKVRVKTTDAYGGTVVGGDETDRDGEYAVPVESVASADYFAVATKKKVKKHHGKHHGKTKFVCDKGVSATISAP